MNIARERGRRFDVGRRAFTLAEMLAVLAIIALLAGISFPVFSAVRRRGDHVNCAENIHQLGVALTLYANDHDGWVPPATTYVRAFLNSHYAPDAEVEASPTLLRTAMNAYVKSEATWFCPADRWKGTDVMYLGQRHRLTSYWFVPMTEGELRFWPPRMQLGVARTTKPEVDSVPLLMDAMGLPQADSDPQFSVDYCARSNHPDDLVNALRHDLSLSRRPAKYWTGGNDCH